MNVLWMQEAEDAMREVALYIFLRFGLPGWTKFEQELCETEHLVSVNPYIGKIDPLFEERSKTYRSVLINRRSKMVYYVENDTVVVAGFWDCRRDPVAAAKGVK